MAIDFFEEQKAKARQRTVPLREVELAEGLEIDPSIIDDLINNLFQGTATITAQTQNRNEAIGTRGGAPQDAVLAANRGAAIAGNQAVTSQLPRINLLGEQSRIDALKFARNLTFQEQQNQNRLDFLEGQQDQQLIDNLFSSAGTFLGLKL